MAANSRMGPLIGGIVSALLMLLGSSMPWGTFGSASISLSTGNNDVTVLCGVAIGATFGWWGLTRSGSQLLLATVPIAALALLIVVVDGTSSSVLLPGNPAVSVDADTGLGIYVTGAGAVGSIVAAAFGLTVDLRAGRRAKAVSEDHRANIS